MRSGFGPTAPKLSRFLTDSADLFNSCVGIGVGLVVITVHPTPKILQAGSGIYLGNGD